jgi:hypothetical protein
MDALKTIFFMVCPTIVIVAACTALRTWPVGWADGDRVSEFVGLGIFCAFVLGLYGLLANKRRHLLRNADQRSRAVARYGYLFCCVVLVCWLFLTDR